MLDYDVISEQMGMGESGSLERGTMEWNSGIVGGAATSSRSSGSRDRPCIVTTLYL